MLNANIAILDSSITTMTIGYNIPASKILNMGYAYYGNLSPFTSIDNKIWIGSVSGGALIGNALSPENSWTIDQKMDDGGTDSSGNYTGGVTGNVRARTGSGGNCLNGSNYYNITLTGPQCRLAMKVN